MKRCSCAIAVSFATAGLADIKIVGKTSQFRFADENKPAMIVKVTQRDPFDELFGRSDPFGGSDIFGGSGVFGSSSGFGRSDPFDELESLMGGSKKKTAVMAAGSSSRNSLAALFGMGEPEPPRPVDPIAALLGGQDPMAGLFGGQPKVVKRIIVSDPFAHLTNEWGHMDEVHNNVHKMIAERMMMEQMEEEMAEAMFAREMLGGGALGGIGGLNEDIANVVKCMGSQHGQVGKTSGFKVTDGKENFVISATLPGHHLAAEGDNTKQNPLVVTRVGVNLVVTGTHQNGPFRSKFSRNFHLPRNVNLRKVAVKYDTKDGHFTVTIPKTTDPKGNGWAHEWDEEDEQANAAEIPEPVKVMLSQLTGLQKSAFDHAEGKKEGGFLRVKVVKKEAKAAESNALGQMKKMLAAPEITKVCPTCVKYVGCYAPAQLPDDKVAYEGAPGAVFGKMYEIARHHKFPKGKKGPKYFAMSRYASPSGHGFVFQGPIKDSPEFGFGQCGPAAVDDETRWAGCATEQLGGFVDLKCTGGERFAVYEILDDGKHKHPMDASVRPPAHADSPDEDDLNVTNTTATEGGEATTGTTIPPPTLIGSKKPESAAHKATKKGIAKGTDESPEDVHVQIDNDASSQLTWRLVNTEEGGVRSCFVEVDVPKNSTVSTEGTRTLVVTVGEGKKKIEKRVTMPAKITADKCIYVDDDTVQCALDQNQFHAVPIHVNNEL